MKLKIKDDHLDALDDACKALGLELIRNKKTYAWWGSYGGDSHAYGEHQPQAMGTCEHAIRVVGDQPRNGSSGPWEIGVVKSKDGDGYKLFYDAYGTAGQRLTAKVGQQANRLRQEYAAAVATRESLRKLSRHGYKVSREDLPGNRIRLKLKKR